MFEQENNFISRIHNYCDRWCERCAFTSRCRVYAIEQETDDEEREVDSEAFWRNLQNMFVRAKEMLEQTAKERGINLNAVSDERYAEHQARQDETLRREDLTRLAERYHAEVKRVLEVKSEWIIFSALDEEIQEEMLGIIYWYQPFIAAKIRRGLSGILSCDGDTDEEELNDSQSDANGSIKIALIAVERSLMAWTALTTKENYAQIESPVALLKTIRRKAEEKFTNAREFIRPGFDEVEMVM
ncbi:MAG: hypothetical protein ACR2HG_15590 [Pyrinomonadaceae bacterium]